MEYPPGFNTPGAWKSTHWPGRNANFDLSFTTTSVISFVFGESSSMEVTVTANKESLGFAAALDVTYASAVSLFGSGNTPTGFLSKRTPHSVASQRILFLPQKAKRGTGEKNFGNELASAGHRSPWWLV